MCFQKPVKNMKNLEEIQKTWKKFVKPGKNFEKTSDNPE